MKNFAINIFTSFAICIILSGCHSIFFKPGLYSNKIGEHIKFNPDSTFEFYYYGKSMEIYSSGVYSVNKKRLSVLTDSANFPILRDVNVQENLSNKFIIDDGGYAKKSNGSINYEVIINDTTVFKFTEPNELIIGKIGEVQKIVVVINSITQKDVYGPSHNSPIYTNPFFITKLKANVNYLFDLKVKLDTRMFYTTFFKEDLRIGRNHLYMKSKLPFFYCPNCTWDKNSMTSPAIR